MSYYERDILNDEDWEQTASVAYSTWTAVQTARDNRDSPASWHAASSMTDVEMVDSEPQRIATAEESRAGKRQWAGEPGMDAPCKRLAPHHAWARPPDENSGRPNAEHGHPPHKVPRREARGWDRAL